jgi:cytochrome c oxidase subunit II
MSWHRAARRDKLHNRCAPPAPPRALRRSREVSLSPARHRRRIVALAVLALGVSACGSATKNPMTTLAPKGPESRYIDHLFFPVFWVAVAVFCLVAGLTTFAIVKFRERPDNLTPRQTHGNTKLELTWTIIPFLLLLGVGTASVIGIFHLYETPSGQRITFVPAAATGAGAGTIQGKVLEVHVIAHRWWFEFDYPGLGTMQDQFLSAGEKPNTALVTAGELHIPSGYMVHLDITSNEPAKSPEGVGPGVIHNFWVPQLAGKIYAVPGHINHLNVEADAKQITDGHPITYQGQCSEFCGLSHANMRFKVEADSPADFASWVANQQTVHQPLAAADQFSQPLAYAGFTLFNGSGGCSTCHTVQGTAAAGQVGPNLTHLQARKVFAGAIFPLNDANLRVWLRDPQAAKPGANMRIRKLTEQEITQLVAYLDTLK